MHRLMRLLASCGLGLVGLAVALVGLQLMSEPVAYAHAPHQPSLPAQHAVMTGYVVVQLAPTQTLVRPFAFHDPVSGLDALLSSGLQVVTSATAFGTAVCSIEQVGCPADNCFCGGSNFWNYSYWDGSAWQGYMVGADSSVISQAGAVEGWAWGPWPSQPPPAPPLVAAERALEWLRPLQQANGGYGGVGPSVEVLIAAVTNGYDAATWRPQAGAPSLGEYVAANAGAFVSQAYSPPAAVGKLAVAWAAAQKANWLCATPYCLNYYDAASGAFYPYTGTTTGQAGPQSWAMLGLVATGQAVPVSATQHLKSLQQANGGWGWAGNTPDTMATALAIQALVASGEPTTSGVITHALAFLKSSQNPDGGFYYAAAWGNESEADSTAYAIQAILAVGQQATADAWRVGASDPISFLLSMQLPDGSFEWKRNNGSNALSTRTAIPALMGRPFPVRSWPLNINPDCPLIYVPLVQHE